MLTALPIPSRDQGKLFDHRANEEAYFTRYATRFGFALPKGETALDVPQCRVVPQARPASLLTWLLHGTRLTPSEGHPTAKLSLRHPWPMLRRTFSHSKA